MHAPSVFVDYARIVLMCLSANIRAVGRRDVLGAMPLAASSSLSNWTSDEQCNIVFFAFSFFLPFFSSSAKFTIAGVEFSFHSAHSQASTLVIFLFGWP